MSEFQQKCYSVSNLNNSIRTVLEGELSDIWVQGEISNFHHHGSGHMYFTLKDDRSELRCVMFKGNNSYLTFKPVDGLNVKLFGNVTIYERRGHIQLIVSNMLPQGDGDLYKSFEALKKTLLDEGMFNKEHKLALPLYPQKVGIVTSSSGAVFKDMVNVLARRAPYLSIIVKSVKVQGTGSSKEIAEAIELFNKFSDVDSLIIGRGGGTIEDLWAFNEESVARAIFKSSIPIISAVGHETDFTIADFVADLRAPTPSAAAEQAAPSIDNILSQFSKAEKLLINNMKNHLVSNWYSLDQLEIRNNNQQPKNKLIIQKEKLQQLNNRFVNFIKIKKIRSNDQLKSLEKQLLNLNPGKVLERGYSIAIDKSNEIIRSSGQIPVGDLFWLNTSDGRFEAKKLSDDSDN